MHPSTQPIGLCVEEIPHCPKVPKETEEVKE